MTDEELSLFDRPIPALTLQMIGLVCLLTATAVLFDGWYVVGALGVCLVFGKTEDIHEALVLVRVVVHRRRNGHG